MNGIVVLTSGGLFSTVTACRAAVDGQAHLLFADWGQGGAADRRNAVTALARHLDCDLTAVDMPHVLQMDGAGDTSANRTTGTPHRTGGANLAIVAAGLNLAEAIGANEIHIGVSERAADKGVAHHRREYVYLVNHLLEELTPPGRRVALKSPLIDLSAAEIVKLGHRLQTPFAHSYSCKTAGDAPCGECAGCRTRQLAFAGANIIDPLISPAQT